MSMNELVADFNAAYIATVEVQLNDAVSLLDTPPTVDDIDMSSFPRCCRCGYRSTKCD